MPAPPPRPIGPLSAHALAVLAGSTTAAVPACADDPLRSADWQLALWCCHEVGVGGFDGIDADGQSPRVATLRAALSAPVEAGLRAVAAPFDGRLVAAVEAAAHDAAAMPTWLAAHGDRRQLADLIALRAPAERRPAAPHLLAVPRLAGPAKAAVVSVVFDERGDGSGRIERAELFAWLAASLDVAPTIEALPAEALLAANLPWLFAGERRLRHALCGHLAARCLTDVVVAQPLATWAARLGADDGWFSLRASSAPAHAAVVRNRLLPALDAPAAAEAAFGARCLAVVESRLAAVALEAWSAGRSPLEQRRPPAAA